MGLSEKEKSRRYRERLKENPQKLAERKRKKRESYQKNKRLISNLNPEEQRDCRIIWKLRKQEQRKRKKAVCNILNDTPPSSPSILQEINIPQEQYEPIPPSSPVALLPSTRKERGSKRIRRDRTKLYKENKTLQSEAKMLKKKYEKYKKRAHRKEKQLLKIKEKQSTEESEETQNKYKTLSNAIKKTYKRIKFRKERNLLKTIFKNIDSSHKTKIIKECLDIKGTVRSRINERIGHTVLKKKITCFFLRDDVSRNTAGKKETVTKGKKNVEKRFLMDSMKNLFNAFKSENPDAKCSYFYFTKHRPFYVVRQTIDGREMCLCKIHTNSTAKIKALRQKRVINAIYISTLILETICDSSKMDCMFGTCVQCQNKEIKINKNKLEGKIQWFEWVREEEIYLKEGKKIKAVKNVKKVKEDMVQNMIENFKEELKTIKKHVFNMKNQYRNFRQSVDEIQLKEAVILVDFSENYNANCTEEIQAHHFCGSRNQITLHTIVVYVHDKDKTHNVLSFCTVSSCNMHQPPAIWAHLHPILTHIKENYPEIDTIHFFSDGPFSQYRQKANFFLTCTKTFDYGFQAFSWSYFEAGRGKGPADGIGGYLKRQADNNLATGKDIIDAFDFYQVLQGLSKVKLFYITKEQIDEIQKDIPKNLLPLSGTKEVHQIFSRIRGQLMHRNLSCFCSRGLCDCLKPKFYSPTSGHKKKLSSEHTSRDDDLILSSTLAPLAHIYDNVSSDDDVPLNRLASSKKDDISLTDLHAARNKSVYDIVYGPSDNSDAENNTAESQPSVSGLNNNNFPTIGDYLLAKVFDVKRKTYHTYACIAQSNIEDDDEIKVTFLKSVKGGKLFILDEKDISYVAYEDIIQKLPKSRCSM